MRRVKKGGGGKGGGHKMTRFVRRDASAAATNNASEKGRAGEREGKQRLRLLGSFHRRLLLYIFMFSSSSLLVFRLGSQPKNYWRAHTITTN